MARAHVEGLRRYDAMTIMVLAGDLLRVPLSGVDRRSLCDLVALSERTDLPVQLTRDLQKYREQMIREFNDLPDGDKLRLFLSELTEVDASRVPGTLREGVLARIEEPLLPRTQELFEGLARHFESLEPEDAESTDRPAVRVEQVQAKKKPVARTEGKRGPQRGRDEPRRIAKPKITPERAEWIRNDVLARLADYPDQGLKQAMLVAGARHRAPWNDLKESEIVIVLKSLESGHRVRNIAGRWIRVARIRGR
jgi:hypothetical protein